MKNYLPKIVVFDRVIKLEEKSQRFYERIKLQTNEDRIRTAIDYLVKQKGHHIKHLADILDAVRQDKEGTDYGVKYSLHVAPYVDSHIIKNFDRRDCKSDNGIGTALKTLMHLEKELILFYSGLKEITDQSVANSLQRVISGKKESIVLLQSLLQETSADIDNLLLAALNREELAVNFYSQARERVSSDTGKRLFSDLIDLKKKQLTSIKSLVEAKNIKAQLPDLVQENLATAKAEPGNKIAANKNDLIDILILAIDAEKNAQARYKFIAGLLADNSTEKKIFEEFVINEHRQLMILEDEFYSISSGGKITYGSAW